MEEEEDEEEEKEEEEEEEDEEEDEEEEEEWRRRCSAAVHTPRGRGFLHKTQWQLDQAGLCNSESPSQLHNSFVRNKNQKGIKEHKGK
jgi:hypothetical protein